MNQRAATTCIICRQVAATRSARTCDDPYCRQTYRQHLAQRTICSICGDPFERRASAATDFQGPQIDLGAQLCRAIACRVQLDLLQRGLADENLVRCGVCGRILLPGHAARGYCHDRDCLILQNAERGRAVQAARERQYAAHVAAAFEVRARQAIQEGRKNADAYLPIVVPHQSAGLVSQDAARVANLALWLETISRSVPAPVARSKPTPPKPDPQFENGHRRELAIVSTGCRLCRGVCCQRGGDNAYLDAEALARAWAESPDRTRAEMRAEYLARVPDRSVENSCIYHGEFGCTLPRTMRAQICNQFLCAGLKSAVENVRSERALRLFLIAADGENLREGEFLDLTGHDGS